MVSTTEFDLASFTRDKTGQLGFALTPTPTPTPTPPVDRGQNINYSQN
ncbi:hypothetical protein [Candidatus Nitrosocosmicus sp. R]